MTLHAMPHHQSIRAEAAESFLKFVDEDPMGSFWG